MAAAGGAVSACAACKYQRRRCTPECQLAEFFPQERPRVFRNAHRLFGVSNILKTLARVGPEHRREAMRAIVFEANAWEAYPAQGCVPVIYELHHRILETQLQLDQVNQNIQAYRNVLGDLTATTAIGGHQVPWTMQTGDQYQMMGSMDMAAAADNVVSQPPQYDHQVDQNSSYDDMSDYLVDNMDDQMPPRRSR